MKTRTVVLQLIAFFLVIAVMVFCSVMVLLPVILRLMKVV